MFALKLPALKSSKSGLPTSLHLGFLSREGWEAGTTVWQVLDPRSYSVLTHANWRVPRQIFEPFQVILLLFLVSEANRRLFWWYFFQPLLWKTNAERRNTLCSQHFQDPHGFVTCYWGGGHAQIHRVSMGLCYLYYLLHFCREGSSLSWALTTRQALNQNPVVVTSHLNLTTTLWGSILINPFYRWGKSGPRGDTSCPKTQ